MNKTLKFTKGRDAGHFCKALTSCEKPSSCVKAVIRTALQRLAPLRRMSHPQLQGDDAALNIEIEFIFGFQLV